MYFIDALNIINLCVDHQILTTHEELVLVQHENGPVLWDKSLLAQELMHDEEGQAVLLNTLKEKGVEHTPFDFTSLDNAIQHCENIKKENKKHE